MEHPHVTVVRNRWELHKIDRSGPMREIGIMFSSGRLTAEMMMMITILTLDVHCTSVSS